MQRLASASAAILAALAVAAVLVGPGAAAAPTGGPIALWANAGNGPAQRIVFVGAIGDYGTALSVNKNGKVDNNGNFVKVKLTKGTFWIDTTIVNKTLNSDSAPQVSSNATCSASFSGSGPVKFFNGTGLYKGISGTANVTISFGGVAPRYKSGPKKGQCKQSSNPRAQFGVVMGQGTVSFAQ
jgi:hypothetical protein